MTLQQPAPTAGIEVTLVSSDTSLVRPPATVVVPEGATAAGFAIATLIYPVARSLRDTRTPSILWLLLAAFPLVLDFSLGYFNIWANTHASRLYAGHGSPSRNMNPTPLMV